MIRCRRDIKEANLNISFKKRLLYHHAHLDEKFNRYRLDTLGYI